MFKNMFNKKPEDKLVIKNDWASYFCRVEDKPASIRLNLALNDIAPIEKYENRIWFSIQLLNPDENGLTTKEEFPTICKIEDDISEALEKIGMILVGALKTNGEFDLYFYTKEPQEFKEIINSIMKNYPGYKFATNCKTDKEWDNYFNFLYPGEYEHQTIQNQKVLINLAKHEDNPDLEREIDHWLYFKTEENTNNYISDVEKLGYNILSKKDLDKGEHAYQLNISKISDTNRNTINDLVWELITLSKEHNGIYDGWGCPIAK